MARLALAVLMVMVVVSVVAAQATAPAAKEVTVKGKVELVKDAAGKVTGSKIVVSDKESYTVAGEKAKDVEKLAGKTVEAKGTVEKKGTESILTVKEVKEVPAPAPAK